MNAFDVQPEHIGFTGTQEGMTGEQQSSLASLLAGLVPKRFIGHHGDCIGADAQFDRIARAALSFEWMVIHPTTFKRANCTVGPRDIVNPAYGPLQRNEHIVAQSSVLVATPKEDSMQLRSGTWTTVRYAIKAQKPVLVILPNGAIVPWQ